MAGRALAAAAGAAAVGCGLYYQQNGDLPFMPAAKPINSAFVFVKPHAVTDKVTFGIAIRIGLSSAWAWATFFGTASTRAFRQCGAHVYRHAYAGQ